MDENIINTKLKIRILAKNNCKKNDKSNDIFTP